MAVRRRRMRVSLECDFFPFLAEPVSEVRNRGGGSPEGATPSGGGLVAPPRFNYLRLSLDRGEGNKRGESFETDSKWTMNQDLTGFLRFRVPRPNCWPLLSNHEAYLESSGPVRD